MRFQLPSSLLFGAIALAIGVSADANCLSHPHSIYRNLFVNINYSRNELRTLSRDNNEIWSEPSSVSTVPLIPLEHDHDDLDADNFIVMVELVSNCITNEDVSLVDRQLTACLDAYCTISCQNPP
jgi:hypothetical protein